MRVNNSKHIIAVKPLRSSVPSPPPPPPPQDAIKEFILIRELNSLVVVDFRFISALPHSFSTVFFNMILCLQSNFMTKYRGYHKKKFTAPNSCRNADLNLILVAPTTDRSILQIIDSLMKSMAYA